jgi:outer membrane protein assembly factor BamB
MVTDMAIAHPAATQPKALRLWPGVALAVLLMLLRFVLPVVSPTMFLQGVLGALLCALLIVLWWLFFSRAPWSARVGAIVLMVVAVWTTSHLVHPSIAEGMGFILPTYVIPVLGLALVAAAVACRRLSALRWVSMIVAIVLACGVFTLLRTDGVTGDVGSQLTWRWTPTAEERLLAQTSDEPKPPAPEATAAGISSEPIAPKAGESAAAVPVAPATAKTERRARAAEIPAEWPGFRGPDRNSVIRDVRIDSDWSKSPPTELWRRAIGPGWSSFAVRGDFLYTQEQRGGDEIVACYKVSSGQPVWRHRDPVRFWESNAGAGPRATPALSYDRVYTLGATGMLNALDAGNGAVAWSRNAAVDTNTNTPDWGFSGSPLVVGDLVIVAISGKLAGYDAATGRPRWYGPDRGTSYSSPQLMTIAGVPQIVMLSHDGATSVAPADGTVLWQHDWSSGAIVQPAPSGDGDVLVHAVAMTQGLGIRRLAVAYASGGWTVQERWTSTGLKPYFNDFVVHKGHAFGFDGSILSCIDLADGKRKWKGGRYGSGQLVLLPEQDLLLVISEEGELALVSASPDQFREVSRFAAIEGKTWNHPVLVRDVLLVRNGEEMAAFRLAVSGR